MDTITFEGKTYRRRNKKWTDLNGEVVHEILQSKLNTAFLLTLDPESLSVEELIQNGDKFKGSNAISAAIRFYEHASQCADQQELAGILPRMTSCYRMQGEPQKAIDILTFASEKYGPVMITPALLTSAAAAYCDLGKYSLAVKCCNRAFAKSGGKANGELNAVYGRIRKESNELDS